MPLMNFAALLIGLTMLGALRALQRASLPAQSGDWALLLLALAIPATALFGQSTEGVSRWLVFGGSTIQPAMIAAPVVAIAFAGRATAIRAAAVAAACLGTALQPDPAAAAMLLGGTAAALATDRSLLQVAEASVAGTAFAFALAATPTLAAVPFVEGVIPVALGHGPVAAGLLVAGIAAMFAPVFAGDTSSRPARMAFAALWAAGLLCALLGSYPTPVVGFGGSAILGYVLSTDLLTRSLQGAMSGADRHARSVQRESDHGLRFA